jgi:hypothetical protein
MCIKALTKCAQPPDFLTGTIGREVYKRETKALLVNWLQNPALDFIFRFD